MFVDPKIDIAFKKIFGDSEKTEILISFLNAVLELPSPIASLSLASPYQVPRVVDLKETTLDIKAIDENGREFVVEMQVEGNEFFGKRALYYLAKSYVGQIKRAEDYQQLKPAYFVGILNFNMLDGADYLTRHVLINQESGGQDLKDFEFNFIELRKFNKTENELNSVVDKWIYFLKNAVNLENIPAVFTEPALLEAFETANQFGWTQVELDAYDYWSGKQGDAKAQHQTALNKGHAKGLIEGLEKGHSKGLEEGRSKGLEEGHSKGLEAGERKKSLEIAMQLLDVLDSSTIAVKVGLSVEDIEKLRKS